jgi:hypothetical protein
VLYIENSSNRWLPPNGVSVPPGQEAKTNGLPLRYAKYLLEERYVYIEAEIGQSLTKIGRSDNPLETSMLLVDFNIAEHLGPETRVKQIDQMVSWVSTLIRNLP